MPKPYPRHLVTVTVTQLHVGRTGNYGSGAHSRSPPFDTVRHEVTRHEPPRLLGAVTSGSGVPWGFNSGVGGGT